MTKVGACLQFEWSLSEVENPIYCSMDLIPSFRVSPAGSMDIARMVNDAMLAADHPPGWDAYLRGYVGAEMHIKMGDAEIDNDAVRSVGLKLLNDEGDRYYFVRPVQPMGGRKFLSRELKDVYCLIKVLKKVFGISRGLQMYMVKKKLRKECFSLYFNRVEF